MFQRGLLCEKRVSQTEVFKALAERGVLQLFKGLKDRDEGATYLDVRKLCARLVCELAFQNEDIQNVMCEYFNFTPICGKVCICDIPVRVLTLLRTKKDLLGIMKKPVSEAKRYWCFPPLDTDNYKATLDHFTLFPDPEKYAVGFVVSVGRAVVSPTSVEEKEQFLNTTTSYLSEDLSTESFTSTSPYSSHDFTATEKRTEVKSLTDKKPALRAYVPQVPPLRFQSRVSHSPNRAVSTDRQSRSPVHRTFQSIEASIQRIRGCLSKCRPVLHALNAKSPGREAPASPHRQRVRTPGSTRNSEGAVSRKSPRCDTERSPIYG